MSILRQARTWTAVLALGISGLAVQQGVTALSFGLTDAFTTSGNTERLASYADAASVGVLARRDLITLAGDVNADGRTDLIAGLLSQAPLDGAAWEQLADVRRDTRLGPDKVAAALALSALTAPNEASVMASRVLLAFPIWQVLPPDTRRSTVMDLVNGGFDYTSQAQRDILKATILAADEAPREEIRAALLLSGKKGEVIIKVLELEKTPEPAAPAIRRESQ